MVVGGFGWAAMLSEQIHAQTPNPSSLLGMQQVLIELPGCADQHAAKLIEHLRSRLRCASAGASPWRFDRWKRYRRVKRAHRESAISVVPTSPPNKRAAAIERARQIHGMRHHPFYRPPDKLC